MEIIIFEAAHYKRQLAYKKYLSEPHWQKFRERIYQKYRACVWCGTTKHLNVHHVTYQNRGHEHEDDVVLLCATDHYALHDGKILLPAVLEARKKAKPSRKRRTG